MTATTGYNKLSGVYEALEKAMLAANPDDEGSCEINPQTPEQHWASGASCIASKSSVCGEHDREQLTWFGHVLLICRPKVSDAGAGPSIGGQQGITSADLHSLYNLQPQEVSGQAQRGLKKVSFSNFGLQLLSISASPEDSAAGGICNFKSIGQSSWEIETLVVHLFSSQHAAFMKDSSIPEDPTPLSASNETALVTKAVTAALGDLKAKAMGEFGVSRVEQRLDACIPAVCASSASIIRNAHSPHLLQFACSILQCPPSGLEEALHLHCCASISRALTETSTAGRRRAAAGSAAGPLADTAPAADYDDQQAVAPQDGIEEGGWGFVEAEPIETPDDSTRRAQSLEVIDPAIKRRHKAYGNIRPLGVQVDQCSEGDASWLF